MRPLPRLSGDLTGHTAESGAKLALGACHMHRVSIFFFVFLCTQPLLAASASSQPDTSVVSLAEPAWGMYAGLEGGAGFLPFGAAQPPVVATFGARFGLRWRHLEFGLGYHGIPYRWSDTEAGGEQLLHALTLQVAYRFSLPGNWSVRIELGGGISIAQTLSGDNYSNSRTSVGPGFDASVEISYRVRPWLGIGLAPTAILFAPALMANVSLFFDTPH